MSKVKRLAFALLLAMTLVQPVFAATNGSIATEVASKEVQTMTSSQNPMQKGRFPALSAAAGSSQSVTAVVQGPLFDNPAVPVTHYGFDADGYMGKFNPTYYFAEMAFTFSALLMNIALNLFALGYRSQGLTGLIGAVLSILHRTFLLAVHLFPFFALLLIGYSFWDLMVKHAPQRFFSRIAKMGVFLFVSYVFSSLVTIGQVQQVVSATNAVGSLFGNMVTAAIEPSAVTTGASLGNSIQLSSFHPAEQIRTTMANGNPLAIVKWETNNPSVATVSPTGEVSVTGVGTATITGITANGQKTEYAVTDGQATEELLDTTWTNTILTEWEYAEMGGNVIDKNTNQPFWKEFLPYSVGSSQRDTLAGNLNSSTYPSAQDAFHALNRAVISEVSFVSNLGAVAYFLLTGSVLFFSRILFLLSLAAGAFVLPLEMFPSLRTGVVTKKWLQHTIMPLFLAVMVNVYSTLVLGVTQIVNQSGVLQIGNAGGTADVSLKILFNGLIYVFALWFAWKLHKRYKPMEFIQKRMDRTMNSAPTPTARSVPLSKRMGPQSSVSRRSPYESNHRPHDTSSGESLPFSPPSSPPGGYSALVPLQRSPEHKTMDDDKESNIQKNGFRVPSLQKEVGFVDRLKSRGSTLETLTQEDSKEEETKDEVWVDSNQDSREGMFLLKKEPEEKESDVNEKKRAYEETLHEIPHQAKELRVQDRNRKISQAAKAVRKGTKAAYFASKTLAPLAVNHTKRMVRSPAAASEFAVDGAVFLASQAKKGAHFINQRIGKVPEPLYPGRRAVVKRVSKKAEIVFRPYPTRGFAVSHKEPEVVEMKEAKREFSSRIRIANSSVEKGASKKKERLPITTSKSPQTSWRVRVSNVKRPSHFVKSTNRRTQTENGVHGSVHSPRRSLRQRMLKDH